MAFFARLFSLASSGSHGTTAPKKIGNAGVPLQYAVERTALGHGKFEVPIQILVDYRDSFSPRLHPSRTDVDARSPLARCTFPAGLTYPDDLYGNAVLSLDYSPLSSPSPVSLYSHCEADDELSLSSPSSESSPEFEFEFSGYGSASTESSSGSPCDSNLDPSKFSPSYTVSIPTKITVDNIERSLQDVQVRLLRSCQDQGERDKLFRYVVLGIYGRDCEEDRDDSDEELESEREDVGGVTWVIHAPKPTHVLGFEYEQD